MKILHLTLKKKWFDNATGEFFVLKLGAILKKGE